MWRTAKVARLLLRSETTAALARANPSFHTRQQASCGPPSSHFRPGPPNELPRVQWTMPSGDHSKRAEVQANDPPTIELVEIHKGDQSLDSVSTEGQLTKKQIGENMSRRDKIKYLLDLFNGLKDSKEAVYGLLDAWVAWERDFPLAAIRRALTILQKDEQWHRIVQVIKWMLSKGQGTTTGTYEQLIRALEKDYRAEEAHSIWVQKFSYDLHSAPWTVCDLMISIYYRNNMLERLVKLFKGLESFGRKPPKKSIVRKVADAYESLGLLEEKNRVMEKYAYLFEDRRKMLPKKSQRSSEKEKSGPTKCGSLKKPEDGLSACVSAISNAESTSL